MNRGVTSSNNCDVFKCWNQATTATFGQHCGITLQLKQNWSPVIEQNDTGSVSCVFHCHHSIQTSFIEHLGLSMQQACLVLKIHYFSRVTHWKFLRRVSSNKYWFQTILSGVSIAASLLQSWKRATSCFPSSRRHRPSFCFLGSLIHYKLPMYGAHAAIVKRAWPKSPHKLSRSTLPFHR